MARPKLRLAHPGIPREVDKYLVPTEKIIFMVHLHPVQLAGPIGAVLGGLILLGIIGSQSSSDNTSGLNLLVLVWLGLAAWGSWAVLDWYQTWFISTDRRLMMAYGIITRKVAMMPLGKMTDMRYDRSIPGKIIGYGKFVVESAGQDQALSIINFVPQSDVLYRQINELLFAAPSRRVGDRPPPMGSKLPFQEPTESWWKRR
ncbi:MAG: hypothetical protein QG608_1933 [Actinomycetota bacterium]|nr:hypothetical protein [Actinomycetota bacterium]